MSALNEDGHFTETPLEQHAVSVDVRPPPSIQASDDEAAHHGIHAGFSLVTASRVGRLHVDMKRGREDRFAVATGQERPWWLLCVADGAGSCARAAEAATVATRTVATMVPEMLNRGAPPSEALQDAAHAALTTLEQSARAAGADIRDYGTTLLMALWWPRPDGGGQCYTFQVGDGLIASLSVDGELRPLATADTGEFACETLFLHSRGAMPFSARVRTCEHAAPPAAIVLLSDGVSDDLVPYRLGGPMLATGLVSAMTSERPADALLDLLSYAKPGSWDDRTLAVAWWNGVPT